MKPSFFFFVVCSFLFISIGFAGSPEEWKSRTIYQLLTDRFARPDGSTDPCDDFHNYCGGTFAGIVNKLDYIQGMGFDAIWISPIPTNYPGGFHGYWQTNFYEVNPYFGTADDLRNLVQECHNRGIWVMLDVVGNHVGPVGYDYSSIVPFNQSSFYHDCNPCPFGCSIQDWTNQPEVEWCRLAGLPDLDQSNSFVQEALLNWVRTTIANFSFDGLRVDTTPEVPKDFWQQYVPQDTYAVGEVFNGDVNYVASYQQAALPGVLSYPLFFTLRNVFANKQSMYNLQSITQAYSAFPDVNLLGTFLDNHDNARFLSQQSDIQIYKNAILYTLYSSGIPIIYYGTEQEFNGGNDPYNREPLWTSNYNTNAPLYTFISQIVQFRKQAQIWNNPQIQRYADDQFYAFSRGQVFVALTNGGSGQSGIQRTITYHPYSNGQKICNLFYPTTDCIVIQNDQFNVYLENGECKVYRPVSDFSND